MIYNLFTEGLLISLFSILIVFLLLGVVALSISLLKYFVIETKKDTPKEQEVIKKSIALSDIKEEDMMVAALVASIDYYNEIKKDVRIISIKQITG
jgi:Na+-transporting methylmalonyl-CoA/oxaloacetate decarboxylase gamma subunit